MVHLYGCTICKNKIPADDNRVHCSDCGSEICGNCYLRKKTSYLHTLNHTDYMMAEASGSMYIRPPAPPMRAAPKANNTRKETKQETTPQTRAGAKRKRLGEDDVYRPAAVRPSISGLKRRFFGRADKTCDFAKVAEDGTFDNEPSSGLSSTWSRSSTAPEAEKSTPLLGGPSTSEDLSPQLATRRRLVSRRDMPASMFDE
ncbi:hypothetical protein VE04_10350 [Pseudogymnoascus sp. 24MN13]|nr:hypothetical protein VE04_10350 [Pseudogymnoascus sp. 24MN13]